MSGLESCDQDPTANPMLPLEAREKSQAHGRAVAYGWQRRPSDPQELCAVLVFCAECARAYGWEGPDAVLPAGKVPDVGTVDQVMTWQEDHGEAHNILWVS